MIKLDLLGRSTIENIQPIETKEFGNILAVLTRDNHTWQCTVDLLRYDENDVSHFKRIHGLSKIVKLEHEILRMSIDFASEKFYIFHHEHGVMMYGFDFTGKPLFEIFLNKVFPQRRNNHVYIFQYTNSIFLLVLNDIYSVPVKGEMKLFEVNESNEVVPLKANLPILEGFEFVQDLKEYFGRRVFLLAPLRLDMMVD